MLSAMMQQDHASTPSRAAPFDDGRGLYPDRITTKAPLGMRDRIRRAARVAGTTSAAFIRDAIEARLRQVGATTTTEA